jgi:hypothetical protein
MTNNNVDAWKGLMVRADSLFAENAQCLLGMRKDVMMGCKMYHLAFYISINPGDNHGQAVGQETR